MSKNPSESKRMPGQGEELNQDTQQGQHKGGQKGMGNPDWKKGKEQGKEGKDQGKEKHQQQHHRQGEPMGQQQNPKQTEPKRQQGGDTEETDDRTRRPA